MPQRTINFGTIANDGSGDTLRGAFSNTNNNFTELYSNFANVTANVSSLSVAANAWSNTLVASANAWSNNLAVSANAWSNTKLSNTAGIFFAGNLFLPQGSTLGIGSTETPAPLTISQNNVVSISLGGVLIDADGSANSYLQASIRNANNQSSASSDWVATTDDGTDTTNFIDLGINGSAFSSPTWTINGARDGYLYVIDTNLSIGSANSTSRTKYVNFFVGGSLSSNEAMRIQDSAGGANVGIGRSNPGYKLDVVGSINSASLLINGSLVVSMDYPYANSMANAANSFATTIGAASNTWANTASVSDRAVANAAANSSNAYTVTVGAASNTWTNTVYVLALQTSNNSSNSSNSYADAIGLSSNSWANTKISNVNRPINVPGNATYYLVAADAGRTIVANTTIVVPNSVFFSGNVVFIYNNTSQPISIVPNSNVLITSTANSFGSRTLSSNGYATLACLIGADYSQNVFTLSGTTVT